MAQNIETARAAAVAADAAVYVAHLAYTPETEASTAANYRAACNAATIARAAWHAALDAAA